MNVCRHKLDLALNQLNFFSSFEEKSTIIIETPISVRHNFLELV